MKIFPIIVKRGKLVNEIKRPRRLSFSPSQAAHPHAPKFFQGCVALKIRNLLSSKLILAAQPEKILDAAITNGAVKTIASKNC